jgi:hypothetical protein
LETQKTQVQFSQDTTGMTEPSRRNYRPPSLSESHAWEPANIERSLSLSDLLLIQPPADVSETIQTVVTEPVEPKQTIWNDIHIITLSFLVHIFLISIFESLFFFFYISALEDNGILNTVQMFIQDGLSVCENMTKEEITVVNEVVGPYINATIIITDGNIAFTLRNAQNEGLLNKAWIYVGVIGAFMVGVAGLAVYRKVRIPWLRICLENLGLVIMLGVYETLFFTTIVHPYQPVTGQEIERNMIEDTQQMCGLFVSAQPKN